MADRSDTMEHLKKVLDPELGINIVDLGLVYRVEAKENRIAVDFTLTYPGCPAGPIIRQEIIATLKEATGVSSIDAHIVWEPLWSHDMMSEEARLSLGYPI